MKRWRRRDRAQRCRAISEGVVASTLELARSQRRRVGERADIPRMFGQCGANVVDHRIVPETRTCPTPDSALENGDLFVSSEFSKRFNSIRSVRASVTSLRSARESRSSDAEVRNIGDADPGRNRTPTERVPGGRVNDHAAVSGPQTRMPTPRIHSTSMQASGTRRCSPSAHAVQPHTRMSERSGATDCGVYQPMTRAYRAAPTRRRLQSTGPKRYPNPLMVLMYFGFAGSDSSLDRRLRMVASTTRVLSWSEPHTFRIR